MPVPIISSAATLRRSSKTITFTGAANLGAIGNVPLFTVTGEVLLAVLTVTGVTTLVGATATLALGVTGNTTFFIAATTATDIAAGDYWIDATPTEVNAALVPAGFKDVWCTDNIIGTVATAAITAGALRLDCWWMALSEDGDVAAA